MRIVRSIVKGFSSFIFLISLIATIFFFGLTEFTQYDNLKPIVSDITYQQAKKQINETQLAQAVTLLCEVNETIKLGFGFADIEVNCPEVVDKPPKEILKIFSLKLFDTIYYKEYSCEFIDCLRNVTSPQDYLVIINKKSHSFFQTISKFSLPITILFLFIFLLACKSWYSRTKDLGVMLILISVPYFVMDVFAQDLLQIFLPAEMSEMVSPAMAKFLGFFSNYFLLLLIGGGLLLLAAFIIKVRIKKQ